MRTIPDRRAYTDFSKPSGKNFQTIIFHGSLAIRLRHGREGTTTCTYMHIHAHTCTYMHTHAHTCTYMHIHTHTYTYMHIHAHTYTYMHIHAEDYCAIVCAYVHACVFACCAMHSVCMYTCMSYHICSNRCRTLFSSRPRIDAALSRGIVATLKINVILTDIHNRQGAR